MSDELRCLSKFEASVCSGMAKRNNARCAADLEAKKLFVEGGEKEAALFSWDKSQLTEDRVNYLMGDECDETCLMTVSMVRCPGCGKLVERFVDECVHCGGDLSGVLETEEHEAEVKYSLLTRSEVTRIVEEHDDFLDWEYKNMIEHVKQWCGGAQPRRCLVHGGDKPWLEES